ncbi:UreD urease accessory protein-domain-containing protein, partial [Gongronella butleri]
MTIQRFTTTASGEPGSGTLVCQCYDNKSKFARIHAQYPLKFIPTRGHADRLAVVYMISYGGGVVAGDRFDVNVDVLENAILLLLTQGNTKIFKNRIQQRKWMALLAQRAHPSLPGRDLIPLGAPGSPASSPATSPTPMTAAPKQDDTSLQIISTKVASNATLVSMPDPVTSFQDSSFTSRQVVHLEDASSQLVLLDWFTSGRLSRGESWAFKYYASRIDVHLGGRLRIKDHMVLEDDGSVAGTTSYAGKLQPYTCFATLVIIARNDPTNPLQKSIARMLALAEANRLMMATFEKHQDILWSASPCLDNNRGILIRIAGMTTEMVRDFVKNECLGQGLKDIVGEGMFGKIL